MTGIRVMSWFQEGQRTFKNGTSEQFNPVGTSASKFHGFEVHSQPFSKFVS